MQRLFDKLPYDTCFQATVKSCEKITIQNDGTEKNITSNYHLILDQTLFFPEEGGQSPDKGVIENIPVIDVQVQDGTIVHTIMEPLEVGQTVYGEIDWNHRFSNMQQHSGEHIFSGLVYKYFGYDNVGFHLSDQNVTMDFNGALSDEDVAMIELEVNKVIAANLPIVVSYPSENELTQLEYRSKKEINEQVRIVTIEGVDVCACCAPHVKSTGEIGMLKVINRQNYKGGVRINILCGFRALEDFRIKSAIISELVVSLSEKTENIVAAVEKIKDVNITLRNELNKKKQELIELKLTQISSDSDDILVFDGELDNNAMRNSVNSMMEKYDGICGIFSGNDTDGYRFIIGSKNKNCTEILKQMKNSLEVRGGGSDKMIQGTVAATEEKIREVL